MDRKRPALEGEEEAVCEETVAPGLPCLQPPSAVISIQIDTISGFLAGGFGAIRPLFVANAPQPFDLAISGAREIKPRRSSPRPLIRSNSIQSSTETTSATNWTSSSSVVKGRPPLGRTIS